MKEDTPPRLRFSRSRRSTQFFLGVVGCLVLVMFAAIVTAIAITSSATRTFSIPSSSSSSTGEASSSSSGGSSPFGPDCEPDSCLNGGTCTPGDGSNPFTCACLPGVGGYRCDVVACATVLPNQLVNQTNVSCWQDLPFAFIPTWSQPFLSDNTSFSAVNLILVSFISPFYYRIVDGLCYPQDASNLFGVVRVEVAQQQYVFPRLLLLLTATKCSESSPICVELRNESSSTILATLNISTIVSEAAGFAILLNDTEEISMFMASSDYSRSTWIVFNQGFVSYLSRWNEAMSTCYAMAPLEPLLVNATKVLPASIQFDANTYRLYIHYGDNVYYLRLRFNVSSSLFVDGGELHLYVTVFPNATDLYVQGHGGTGFAIGNGGNPWMTQTVQPEWSSPTNETLWIHFDPAAAILSQNLSIFGYNFPPGTEEVKFTSSPWGAMVAISADGKVAHRNCQDFLSECLDMPCALFNGTCVYEECRCEDPPFLGLYAPQQCFFNPPEPELSSTGSATGMGP